jgi:hypothetical protein
VGELVGGTRFRVIRALGLGELLHGPSGRTVRLADLTPGSWYAGERPSASARRCKLRHGQLDFRPVGHENRQILRRAFPCRPARSVICCALLIRSSALGRSHCSRATSARSAASDANAKRPAGRSSRIGVSASSSIRAARPVGLGTPRDRGVPRALVLIPMPAEPGKDLRAFDVHRLQTVGIQAQRLEQGRGHLRGLRRAREGLRRERRIRQQQHHADVIVRKPTVLRLLRCALGVGHADVGSHDDVRSARILRRQARGVEQLRERTAPENLSDPGDIVTGGRLRLERRDFGLGRASGLEPQQRHVVLGWPDLAAGVGFGIRQTVVDDSRW